MTPVFFRLISHYVSIDCFCYWVQWSPPRCLSHFTIMCFEKKKTLQFSCLYNSHMFWSCRIHLVMFFFLSLFKGELHVSSVGSLWTQQRSRCRPSQRCTGVSYTVWWKLINKWVCVASTRAPRQHWWPTSQKTLCSSCATVSVSKLSALQPECTVILCWGGWWWWWGSHKANLI